ncbi:MAG: hypothetical protein NZ570_03370 [Candidatus Caldarchaeum sp.]|nr:hypothetical protein [Candidatus Caldarchaeum sp.]MCS7137190.1 hypothetical protein [Candidatus Caldarchaeum sp.]
MDGQVSHHLEIVLKGRRRSYFEKELVDNLMYVLGGGVRVVRDENRIVLDNDSLSMVERIRKV